ncbi:MAG: condensation domain-containing protein, partial [Planctomycetaceae bacterium]
MDPKAGSQIKLSAKQRELLERRLLERSASGAKRTGIPRRAPSETAQLSFAQQRLWFLNILEPESSQYNLANSIRLVGRLNYDALLSALKQVVERHEILRTTIHRADGTAYQKLNTDFLIECPVFDVSHLDDGERSDAVQAWMKEFGNEPFELSTDLMLRAGLCRLADEEHVLFLVMHHIASDAWSVDLLLRDLGEAYAALDLGRDSALSELPIQYADYAVWQREWFTGPVLQKQLAYWRKQLEGAPPTLELPTDVPR